MNNTIQKIDVAALVAELDAAREYIKELLEELRQARELEARARAALEPK